MENNPPDMNNRVGCQVETVPHLSVGRSEMEGISILIRIKLFLKRSFTSEAKRTIKKLADKFITSLLNFSPKRRSSEESSFSIDWNEQGEKDKAKISHQFLRGQMVRIRSKDEIQATLNLWREMKGCNFMEEMYPYCGTAHTIIRVVERFVDERDYLVKKARGLYLLDGVMCEGTRTYGRCDRACFFFWREEWLEAVEENNRA